MTEHTPTVTIAIPTFNRRNMVLQAIDSSLKQTYHSIEVIVADNASEDGTESAIVGIKDPRLHYYRHNSNIGFSANWNFCLSKASGEYFILLSDDDLLKPEAIGLLLAPFLSSETSEVAFVYGRVIIDDKTVITGADGPISETVSSFTKEFFAGRRSIYPCSTLLRTADVRELGGYDEARFHYALDAAIWVGTGFRRRTVFFVPDIIGKYRMHSGNLTSTASCHTWIDGLGGLFRLAAEMVTQTGMNPDEVLKEENKFIGRLLLHLLKSKNSVRNLPAIQAALPYIGFKGVWTLVKTAIRDVVYNMDKLYKP